MFHGARVAVIVPAYNEALLIRRTLVSVPAFVDRIVVIDDHSEDATAARVSELADPRVELVRHDRNRGVGAALATGYRAAFAWGADVVAVMAGDAQMDARDLPALLAPVVSGEVDYAKGDRLSWPEARARMPFLRWLGNHTLSFLTRLATGLSVRDSQCGYTAMSRRAAESVELEQLWEGYGYPNDLLGRLAALGFAVRDVPVRPVYGDERSGIGWRHALVIIPWVLLGVVRRRARATILAAPGRSAGIELAPPR